MLISFINKHSGINLEEVKSMNYDIPTRKVLWKSIRLGLQVKTPLSLLISILGIPGALLPLVLSKQLQQLTDLLFERNEKAGIALLVLGVLFLIQVFFQAITEYYAIHDKYQTRMFIKEFILKQVCNVHYSYIENRDDFLKKIEFVDSHATSEMSRNIQTIFSVLQQTVTCISISLALWVIHPALVFIILLTSIPAAVLSYQQSDETFRHRAKWSQDGTLAIHLYHWCASSEHGIQEVRHYELFDYLKARWRAVADSYIHKKRKLTVKHLRSNIAADFLRSAVYLVILLLTARQIYNNPTLGLGVFTLVYTLSDKLQKSTGSILTQIMEFAANLAYLKEFFSLENLEQEEEDRGAQSDLPNHFRIGEIKFENVSFSYPNSEQEVLHDISVSIHKGEKIAIVGDNGSGKSTFISLLTGMFTPEKGKIQINGVAIEDHKRQLRERISVIFQDFAHYEDTLRENIVVSDSNRNLTDKEIVELAQSIHVEDVIEEQPNGLDGLLGHMSQKGNDLSGGQWQKIALLRAVHRNNTDIMVLDEPTAALDPLAEAELYRNFSRITGDRTTLLISHRLGITKLVDRILVFQDGRIIEDGSHQELMEKKGHYYTMYQAQASWYQTT